MTIRITNAEFINRFKPKLDRDGFPIPADTSDQTLMDVPVNRIWTCLDCDGKIIIASGRHWVNRMYYLVCEMPTEHNLEYEVIDDHDDETDDDADY